MEAIKLCQTDHGGVMIPAVGSFGDGDGGRRFFCQTCLDHKRSKASAHSASARARNKSKPNYSYQVKDAVEPSAPPAFREYRPAQSMLDASEKALAYSWRRVPSLKI